MHCVMLVFCPCSKNGAKDWKRSEVWNCLVISPIFFSTSLGRSALVLCAGGGRYPQDDEAGGGRRRGGGAFIEFAKGLFSMTTRCPPPM